MRCRSLQGPKKGPQFRALLQKALRHPATRWRSSSFEAVEAVMGNSVLARTFLQPMCNATKFPQPNPELYYNSDMKVGNGEPPKHPSRSGPHTQNSCSGLQEHRRGARPNEAQQGEARRNKSRPGHHITDEGMEERGLGHYPQPYACLLTPWVYQAGMR